MENDPLLDRALQGDINAFQTLFAVFQPSLKSYLYRLLTNRDDVDDVTHDTFIKAFDKRATFQRHASLKTWVFKIATNLAYDHLRKLNRWPVDAQDQGERLAKSSPEIIQTFRHIHRTAASGNYEMKEHIDFCFTCISKTLVIEKQVALILKDIYDFPVKEIASILDKTEGVVKHLLVESRSTMSEIFEHRCALINKEGICHQCSEMNGIYNPKHDQHQQRMALMPDHTDVADREALYTLRAALVKAIDPLHSSGTDLQDALMQCTRRAIGE
ncbi:RNA polymerase sigma factor [Chryseolinea lacunae]|uniref:RNA polymerase sigma factor n=1 Tax=Chryseolinea lacunae TaxID=2801331 RepID=A0ABS1KLX7_9BACT|nr:RNA polymerase sigma factor [Chryseolinea lacunae]MBL0740460.1 RNA polymerase sigma factor [Chryseolinea lacunae]